MAEQNVGDLLQLLQSLQQLAGQGQTIPGGQQPGLQQLAQLLQLLRLQQALNPQPGGAVGPFGASPGGQNDPVSQLARLKLLGSLRQGQGQAGWAQPGLGNAAPGQLQRLRRLQQLLGVGASPGGAPANEIDPEVARRQRRQMLEFRIGWLETLIEKMKKEIEQMDAAGSSSKPSSESVESEKPPEESQE